MMDLSRAVAVYPGPFDPPGLHHQQTAETLVQYCTELVIVPSDPGGKQDGVDNLPLHRAVMADLNFGQIERVTVDLEDIEQQRFTPPGELLQRYDSPERSAALVITSEAVRRLNQRDRRLLPFWPDWTELFSSVPFIVLHEPREPLQNEDLPKHHCLLEVPAHSTSALIRSVLFDGGEVDRLLSPKVADYIHRHGLFRATPPSRECIYRLAEPRIKIVADHRNPAAMQVADSLARFEHDRPEVIVAIGGDGTMLRAIRRHWRERLPIYGVNAGTLGFLLNDRDGNGFWEKDLRLYQLPLLWVELVGPDGETTGGLAFNDSWIERETGQTAWIEVSINGQVQLSKLVADGILVATAAGSTSYARAMGGTPLPFNAPLLTLAGSNVLKPEFWHPAVLTNNSIVKFRNLDPVKRPLRAYIDGVPQKQVVEMTVRVSHIAAVELLFAPEHDPVSKLAMLQFPHLPG